MATHDYVIANQSGAAFRTDLNNALAAIVSNNSNSSEPSTKYAYQWWADTSASIFKIRNSSNDGWINLFTLAGGIDVDAASNFNEDVTFTGASANIVFDKSSNELLFADNAKCSFGNNGDLVIRHNGTHSIIEDVGTGNLQLRCADFRVTNADNSETLIKADTDGGVELYFNNGKKFQTISSGNEFFGQLKNESDGTANGIYLGASNDLQLYHDSNSIVANSNNSANLILQSDNFTFRANSATTEKFFKATKDGATELYYDAVKKLETDASGVTIGGTTAERLKIDGSVGNCIISSSGAEIEFTRAATSNITCSNAAGALKISVAAGDDAIQCLANAAVELYHNGNKKLETDSLGVQITGFLHAHEDASDSDFTALTRHVVQSNTNYVETLFVESSATNPYGQRIAFSDASPDNNTQYFFLCRDQSVDRLIIWSDGDIDNHDNSYGGTSDEKLKENIVDANSQWEDVKAVKVRNFNFKTDTPSDKRLGVVAQEIETICPSLVRETTDYDNNNNDLGTKTKSVKYSILYMKAFKALQEAIAKIEVLETKVAALEAA